MDEVNICHSVAAQLPAQFQHQLPSGESSPPLCSPGESIKPNTCSLTTETKTALGDSFQNPSTSGDRLVIGKLSQSDALSQEWVHEAESVHVPKSRLGSAHVSNRTGRFG